MSINKEELLKKSQGGFLVYKAVIKDLKLSDNKTCKNCKNPFYKDKNPSFSVYKKGDKWLFRDYGDCEYKGDVFVFASIFFDLDFKKDFPLLLEKMDHLLTEEVIVFDNKLLDSSPVKQDAGAGQLDHPLPI